MPMHAQKRKVASHEPHPLTPSLSPNGGEGGRRPGEGDSWFMAPTHVQFLEVFPLHEPPPHPVPLPLRGGEGAEGPVRGLTVPMHAQKRNVAPTLVQRAP